MRLAAVAELPQNDWTESLTNQLRMNLRPEEGALFKYAPIETNQIRLLCLIPSQSPDAVLEAMMMVSNFPNTVGAKGTLLESKRHKLLKKLGLR
jgi:hypothetical protein